MRLDELPPVPGVRHRTVGLPGVRLHLAEAGEGPPVLLLHGWPQHWWSWRRLIGPLAARHRVLAPDLRGHGWSDAPTGAYPKGEWVADVLALLDHEGLERVAVMGHDWGAFTGLLLALEHPERVERLVALDVAPPWPPRPQARHLGLPVFGSYAALLATPVIGEATLRAGPAFVRALIRAGSGPDARWSTQELDAYALPLRDPRRARASSAIYRTFLTRELPVFLRRSRPARLHPSSLLVLGAASPLRRAVGTDFGPALRVETVPRAGHFLPEEAPDEIVRLAGPFLAGARGPAA